MQGSGTAGAGKVAAKPVEVNSATTRCAMHSKLRRRCTACCPSQTGMQHPAGHIVQALLSLTPAAANESEEQLRYSAQHCSVRRQDSYGEGKDNYRLHSHCCQRHRAVENIALGCHAWCSCRVKAGRAQPDGVQAKNTAGASSWLRQPCCNILYVAAAHGGPSSRRTMTHQRAAGSGRPCGLEARAASNL